MLIIMVGATDVYDERDETFHTQGGIELQLEHSLLSLSKWEAKYEKPFLSKEEKSTEEIFFYIKCMTVYGKVTEEIVHKLSEANLTTINDYINAKMTATWFNEKPGPPRASEVITAEVIYYWMTLFQIPFECEKWHLNRLFTLIRICNIKQDKPKKMSRSEMGQRNRELNAQRKKQLGTTG